MNEHFFIYNSKFFRSGVPVISAQNRSFRYGDGLFETMRICEGDIVNVDFHFERLNEGMKMLNLCLPNGFSKEYFIDAVNQLLSKNSILPNARIRLAVFHGDEGLFETTQNPCNFIIETFALPAKIDLNEKGLLIDLFPDGRKSFDHFSHLKSSNYLVSAMAAQFAIKNNLDDVLLLNSFERICESSIANVFTIQGENIFTPPLTEGCVAGTMRRWLLEKFSSPDFSINEKSLTVEDVLTADELFLTNAIRPVRWVKQFQSKVYKNKKVKELFDQVIQQI